MKVLFVIFRWFTEKISTLFVFSQYVSVAWLSFSHGANDAQKGMAIIGMMLLANGVTTEFNVPMWAIIWCASAITLGTMFGGSELVEDKKKNGNCNN
jgi:PiT family inorganic phosphate transporter